MAFRRRIYSAETWVLLWRDCPGAPIVGGEAIEPRLVVKRATAADAPAWRESWAQNIDWYVERIARPDEACFLGLIDGRLAVHCWYGLGDWRDEKLGYTFRCGPHGAYLGEGWVHPDFREHGVATAFNRRVFGELLPALGVKRVLTYRAASNLASEKLHARLQFVETHRLRHRKILGQHTYSLPLPTMALPRQSPA